MNMKNKGGLDYNLTVLGIATWIVFAILQWITKTIDWANTNPFWFWFPLWAGLALDIVYGLLMFIVFGFIFIFKKD